VSRESVRSACISRLFSSLDPHQNLRQRLVDVLLGSGKYNHQPANSTRQSLKSCIPTARLFLEPLGHRLPGGKRLLRVTTSLEEEGRSSRRETVRDHHGLGKTRRQERRRPRHASAQLGNTVPTEINHLYTFAFSLNRTIYTCFVDRSGSSYYCAISIGYIC